MTTPPTRQIIMHLHPVCSTLEGKEFPVTLPREPWLRLPAPQPDEVPA